MKSEKIKKLQTEEKLNKVRRRVRESFEVAWSVKFFHISAVCSAVLFPPLLSLSLPSNLFYSEFENFNSIVRRPSHHGDFSFYADELLGSRELTFLTTPSLLAKTGKSDTTHQRTNIILMKTCRLKSIRQNEKCIKCD